MPRLGEFLGPFLLLYFMNQISRNSPSTERYSPRRGCHQLLGPARGSTHTVREPPVRFALRVFGRRECIIRVVYTGMRTEGIARIQSIESVDSLCRDLDLDAFSIAMVPPLHSMVSILVHRVFAT